MKNIRNISFYVGTVGGFSALMFWLIAEGSRLEQGRTFVALPSQTDNWHLFVLSMQQNMGHPLAVLLAQIFAILLVARIFGWICRKIGQPTVMGEMIAGIALGPSLLGMWFPEVSAWLFREESLGNLQFLSQIGLILFMFIVGMELDLKVLKNKANEAVVVSHASIIVPFALGVGLAYFLYPLYAPGAIRFVSFALFIGITMSITAFPVLARIVQERNMHKTRLGTLVFTCAAADDVTAWCILALAIAIVKAGSLVSALMTVVLSILYVLVMIKGVRPFLARIGQLHSSNENLSKPIVAIFFLMLILSSFATEIIGIHALFGAFMAGAIMPENEKFRSLFIEKIEDLALVLLLPLFFVYTGIRTDIGLLSDPSLWKIAGVIILVAVVGKFLGSALAARFVGQNWKESLTIGALMNTRGLMELVVLNIGYDLGVLSPEIFAIMICMALVTTLMTAPSLDLINYFFAADTTPLPSPIQPSGKYKILISFGHPERGRSLLRLANNLSRNLGVSQSITAMHLSPANELNRYNEQQYLQESFSPILEESRLLNLSIGTLFKPSVNIASDIAETANQGGYDLLLMGAGQSVFEGSLLGKVVGFTSHMINPTQFLHRIKGRERWFKPSLIDSKLGSILRHSKSPAGMLIDRSFTGAEIVWVAILDESELFLLNYAFKLIQNSGSKVTVIDIAAKMGRNALFQERIETMKAHTTHQIEIVNFPALRQEMEGSNKLLITGIAGWRRIISSRNEWIANLSSILILHEPSKAEEAKTGSR